MPRAGEDDDGAAEAAAGDAGAEHAALGARDLDHRVDIGERHLVVVPQRGVRSVEQPAELGRVAIAQGLDSLQHPSVLGNHVAGAAVERGGQRVDVGAARLVHVAQRRDAEQAGRFDALLLTLPVAARRMAVPNPRVDDGDFDAGRQLDQLRRERAGVDEDRLPGLPERAGQRIHRADGNAEELCLDALRQRADGAIVEGQLQEGAKSPQQRHDERGARRQAAAERDVRADDRVEPRHLDARGRQHVRDALDVVEPVTASRLPSDDVGRALRVVGHGVAERADGAVLVGGDGHARALRDHRRQDEPAVVVGVLADEVDTPRRLTADRLAAAEMTDELVCGNLCHVRGHDAGCSRPSARRIAAAKCGTSSAFRAVITAPSSTTGRST